jgi:hypothetical protein
MEMLFSRLLLIAAAALPLGACVTAAEQQPQTPPIAADDNAACVMVNPGPIRSDGVANRELRIRAGHGCRLSLSSAAGWHINVHDVYITVPPEHGILRTSETTGGSGVVTYVPAPGFIGHDRFEVIYRWTDFIRPVSAVYKAEVTVTP